MEISIGCDVIVEKDDIYNECRENTRRMSLIKVFNYRNFNTRLGIEHEKPTAGVI